jgi:tRNA uridine 5-carbamoylmethylation protein Kti12
MSILIVSIIVNISIKDTLFFIFRRPLSQLAKRYSTSYSIVRSGVIANLVLKTHAKYKENIFGLRIDNQRT